MLVDFFSPGFWSLENPRGRIKRFVPELGNHRLRFDPWEYAGHLNPPDHVLRTLDRIRIKDGKGITPTEADLIRRWNVYTKETFLWGNFNLPEKKPIEPVKGSPTGTVLQRQGGRSNRTKEIRSNTPLGFAKAFYIANQAA